MLPLNADRAGQLALRRASRPSPASPLLVALEPLVERGWLAPAPSAEPAPASTRARVDFAAVVPLAHGSACARPPPASAAAPTRGRPRRLRRVLPPRRRTGSTTTRCSWRSTRPTHARRGPGWRWPAPLARRDAAALAHGAAGSTQRDRLLALRAVVLRHASGGAHGATPTSAACTLDRRPADLRRPPLAPTCWARPDLYLLDDAARADRRRRRAARLLQRRPASAGATRCTDWDRRCSATATPGGSRACGGSSNWPTWLRIDHFRGFAGYWEIPADEPTTAIDGRWVAGPGRARCSRRSQRALGRAAASWPRTWA
ncbi:MAG: 4-alpha-glucanotransferase [Comamonadaceae bacterium]|nr:4-alpha-glucanotransferase [Comamonadaceae bacterium]